MFSCSIRFIAIWLGKYKSIIGAIKSINTGDIEALWARRFFFYEEISSDLSERFHLTLALEN
jgi:hypothetical protein